MHPYKPERASRANMQLIDASSPDYARIVAYAVRRTPTGLLTQSDPPQLGRFAAIVGPAHAPRSVAILSAYGADHLTRPSADLGHWLIDERGEAFSGTLADLTQGEPFMHIELFESFDRGRGYARRIVTGLSGSDLLVGPSVDVIGAYARLGFEPTGLSVSIPERPLMRKRASYGFT